MEQPSGTGGFESIPDQWEVTFAGRDDDGQDSVGRQAEWTCGDSAGNESWGKRRPERARRDDEFGHE